MPIKRPKILVVGDLMIDHYVMGECSRISPEAPVQVVDVKGEENRLGGACNVAHNLIALGAEVEICGVVGEDINAEKMRAMLEKLGIKTDLLLTSPNRPTIQKSRILVANQQILRIDYEEKGALEQELLEQMLDSIRGRMGGFDAVILSDYGKGVLSETITQALIALANAHSKPILCDPKGKDYSKYKNATLLTPNKKEASEATGIALEGKENIHQALQKLKNDCALKHSIITLSEDGIGLLDNDELVVIPTQAQEVYDVTGAGDTVISALAFALSCGKEIKEACKFANTAAAIVVAKVGSATASLEEISHFQKSHSIASKIITLEELPHLENIVFTNGCFDILHKGHAQYLQQAKSLGDFLIVGLNSDSSVRELKGENRPINSQEDRAYLLASLECVDYVIIFDELTPYELIRSIAPKVLVKGADYEGKEIVGSEFAQSVRLLEFVEGRSTSNIVKKIQESSK